MPRTFSLDTGSNVMNGIPPKYLDEIKEKQKHFDRQTPLPSPDNILTRAELR